VGSYSIAEAKDGFSRLIAEVERGHEVTITRHGKPVATIVPNRPAVTAADSMAYLKERLAKQPPVKTPVTEIMREIYEDGL